MMQRKMGSVYEEEVKNLVPKLYHMLTRLENLLRWRCPASNALDIIPRLRERVPDVEARAHAYASKKGCACNVQSPHILLGCTNLTTEEDLGFFMYFPINIILHLYVSSEKTIMQKEYASNDIRVMERDQESVFIENYASEFIGRYETRNGVEFPVRHREYIL